MCFYILYGHTYTSTHAHARTDTCVQSNAWSNCATHFQLLGEEGFQLKGLVKHEPFLSLKEKLCLNQSLFAPAVICLRTSAGANKHVRLRSAREKATRSARRKETKWDVLHKITQREILITPHTSSSLRASAEARCHDAGDPTTHSIPRLHV